MLLQVRPASLDKEATSEVAKLVRSGCGTVGRDDFDNLGLRPVQGQLSLSAAQLLRLGRTLRSQQHLRRMAGGVHAAGIFDNRGRTVVVREDIGRHNAVDKAIGHCILHGQALGDKILVGTGRASYDMITKSVRLGIPIVATISACTSLAVEMADTYNVTLIGYLRGKHCTIYTHPQRIMMDSGGN